MRLSGSELADVALVSTIGSCDMIESLLVYPFFSGVVESWLDRISPIRRRHMFDEVFQGFYTERRCHGL